MRPNVIYGVIVVLSLTFLFGELPVLAEQKTGYVTDMLILTMRGGPGKEFRVQRALRSDTQVTILEEKGDYFKVQLKNGEQGWVDSQYITMEIPARMVIGQLEQKITVLEKQHKKMLTDQTPLEQKLDRLKTEYEKKVSALEIVLKEARVEKNKAVTALEEIKARYETLVRQSENVVTVMDDNNRLQKENSRISKQIQILGGDNEKQLKTGMIKWFLAGAGALLAGWLIGRSMGGGQRKGGGLLS